MTILECASCGEHKEVSEFPKDARKKHGVGSECKNCLAARARAKRRGITCTRAWVDDGWTCTKCNTYKPLTIEYFYKVNGRQLKFDVMCRDCRNAYHTEHRKKDYDSEERRARRARNSVKERQIHQKVKIQCIQHKGSKCSSCGIQYDGTNGMIFDFHHIDPATKSFEILKSGSKTFNAQVAELDKCILLCANCHRKEHSDKF